MTRLPLHCVVDTNVAATANGVNDGAPVECMVACGRALQDVMRRGHVYLDDEGRIADEYRRNLSAGGERGAGDVFFKWLLTHEWGGSRVTRVPLTPRANDPEDFEELPAAAGGVEYDPSDRKFLAVAAAHRSHPAVLQAFDSKWWGWKESLEAIGVTIHFLCAEAIEAKYSEKMG